MVAPVRFLSGRQQQQKIGVPDSTEDLKVLEVVGRAGIGTTIFEPDHELDIRGTTKSTTYLGEGGALTLGSSSDGSLTTSGALNTFTSNSSIVNSIDELNELSFNIIRNTAVTEVGFTANTTAGAATLNVTLTITSSGNANRYDIDWGDGSSTSDTTDSTPSHAYTNVAGGLYTVVVTAKNSSGVGAGSSQTLTKAGFITVYTPAPVMGFNLYRASSGGSALTGNDLYVVDNTGGTNSYNELYLDNTTTNASGVGIGATYSVNWGDGSSVTPVNSDTDAGGSSGARLAHTWADGTSSGTSRDTVTLTILNHNTTDPAEIPKSTTTSLKVYQDDIAAPSGLSSKTLNNVSSTGTSPKLASGFTDNTGGATISAGDDVNRVTGGTATAGPITTFAYNANSGTLTANVNGSADGSRALTTGDDSGTYTSLVIDSESDYQLLNSSGSSTTFANSTYYPGLYKGFKARVAKSVASLSTGANSMQLLHSATGNTNVVEFVKDNLTASPTVNIGSATLTQNVAGIFRYISGVPYYNSGSPSLTLAGVTIDDLVGQCYTNQSNIVEVDDGTNQESTSSDAITNSNYTYANIDGSTTMLSSGVPKVNTGTSSAYAIGSLTVPITSSNVRTISRVKVRARNVNGVSSYSSDLSTIVQVHKSAQSGISEIAISVADALGAGFDDDGVRIYDFKDATTDTPSYTGSTNFYTNQPYTESLTSATVGIKEAIVRLGVIKFDQTNFSSGYLPVGPNRSSAPSTQYFTFAFRRTPLANFNINIVSSSIAGLWIAAPGSGIDNTSGLNGWLRADTQYNGSGTPGSGAGGNGSDGCAVTGSDRIQASTSLNGSFEMTLGSENLSSATGNVALVRIALTSGQSVTSLSVS
jgi:PKD repeat protein